MTVVAAGETPRRSLVHRSFDLVRDMVKSLGEDFILAEVRDGRIRTKGLPPGVRAGVIAGVVATLGVLVSIVFADRWRALTDVVAISGGQPLRGTLVPGPLVPVTFGLIALGVALGVNGALRSRVWVTAPVVFTYVVLATSVNALRLSDGSLLDRAAGWAIPAVAVVAVAVRFLRPRPGLELAVIAGLVTLTFANSMSSLAEADNISGGSLLPSQTGLILNDIAQLSIPILIVAALDVAEFGVQASQWVVGFVDRRIGQRATAVALVVLALWRGRDVVDSLMNRIDETAVSTTAGEVFGSALLLAVIAGAVLGVRRLGRQSGWESDPERLIEASRRVAHPLSLVVAAALVIPMLIVLTFKTVLVNVDTEDVPGVNDFFSSLLADFADFASSTGWDLLIAAVLALIAVVVARRGRSFMAAFVAVVAVVHLAAALTDPGRVLEGIAWRPYAVDVLVVGCLVGLFVVWTLRGELSDRRMEWGVYLLLLSGLLDQQNFISDPFAPFLAFAGVGFVLFGLVWGFATGCEWANDSSDAVPRASRAQLVIGFHLLSVVILHWFAVTHDVAALELLSSTVPDHGTAVLGQPFILLLLLTAMAAVAADIPLTTAYDTDGDDTSDEEIAAAERARI